MAVSAVAFEGRVTLAMKSSKDKDKEMTVAYAMKGGLVRMEPQMAEARGTAMIMNWAKQEMIMIMPEQQMYMTMPLKAHAEAAQEATGQPEQKIEKTGRTETILGYLCEEYVTHGKKGETVEMWVTDKLGAFAGLGSGGGGPMGGRRGGGAPAGQGWEQLIKGKEGFFPLRVISHDASGKDTFTMQATQIQPGDLPDSLFAPPEGYQSFQMPNMGNMGGLNPFKHN
jgi:hypothetical protein